MKKKIILLSVTLIFLFAAYVLFRERHLIYMFKNSGEVKLESSCDTSLWLYNAEKEHVVKPCITLSGVVESRRAETDGDENIQLKPDPNYVRLLNIWNILGQRGNIAVEPICENTPSKKDFVEACKGYKSNITLPSVGDHVSVAGSYGTDKHGWAEIHPVTKIVVIH